MRLHRPDYPITFYGPWHPEDQVIALAAVHRLAASLVRFIGRSTCETFRLIFGDLIFKAGGTPKGCSAFTYAYSKMTAFTPNQVSEPLVIHEMWHRFLLRMPSMKRPFWEILENGIIDENGRKVTGRWRYAGLRAPENGYHSDDWRKLWQVHPLTLAGGSSSIEDFCDIGLNWTRRTFVDNPAGRALYSWFDNRLPAWLSTIPGIDPGK